MSRLSDLSSNPTVRQYALGAAQTYMSKIADFIAPTVDVSSPTGKYKVYTEKNRFRLPDTRRQPGARATRIGFDATDANYNCTPHALDFPVDIQESAAGADLENVFQEASNTVAEVASLDHEKTVIDAAVASFGSVAPGAAWSGSSGDPVTDIDGAILTVLKNARYGGMMGVGLVFGATAWKLFKNNVNVRAKFIVGKNAAPSLAIPDTVNAGQLFLGNPDVGVTYAVYDTTKEGLTDSISFLLDSTVLIFARHPNPTRRDPSAMKTFRLSGQWMVPGSYMSEDGRSEVAKMDWSEEVVVTNSAAGKYITVS